MECAGFLAELVPSGLTLAISSASLVITWFIAVPVGVYSVTRQYSIFDHIFTVVGFLGKGIHDFLLALVLMWIAFAYMNLDVGGLFSPQYQNGPWSTLRTHEPANMNEVADYRIDALAQLPGLLDQLEALLQFRIPARSTLTMR